MTKPLDIPGDKASGIADALPFLIHKNVDSPLLDIPPIDVKGRRVGASEAGTPRCTA